MPFQPDAQHLLDVLANRRPARLPIYEHSISPKLMEEVLDVRFADLERGDRHALKEFFRHYCRFWPGMGYDTVSFEVRIADVLPGRASIAGSGPIQNRADLERYPWNELPARYWAYAEPKFDALALRMPRGVRALGGVGGGIFELSADLVGGESLAHLQTGDPGTLAELYRRMGDLVTQVWTEFLARYGDLFVICRTGDDLSSPANRPIAPEQVRQNLLPQYRRVIGTLEGAGKPVLWHAYGCAFSVMDDLIALGVGASHVTDTPDAPLQAWIAKYGDRIGLLGGVDVGLLAHKSPDEIAQAVFELGRRFRMAAQGFALASGASIPASVPVDGYLAMIEGVKRIRAAEERA